VGELLGADDGEGGGDGGGAESAIGLGAAEGKLVFTGGYGANSLVVDLGEGAGIEFEGDVLRLAGVMVETLTAGEGLFGSEAGLGRDELELCDFVSGEGTGVFHVRFDGECIAGFEVPG
jgi:hypothetical protein